MRWIKYDDERENKWNGASANKTRRSRAFVIPQSISSFVSLLNPRIVIRSSSHFRGLFWFSRIGLDSGPEFRWCWATSQSWSGHSLVVVVISHRIRTNNHRVGSDWSVTGLHYYSSIQLTAVRDWTTLLCIFYSLSIQTKFAGKIQSKRTDRFLKRLQLLLISFALCRPRWGLGDCDADNKPRLGVARPDMKYEKIANERKKAMRRTSSAIW